MRNLKTHLAINKPGGTFVKTACGRVLLASDMGRARVPEFFDIPPRRERCARCDDSHAHWLALARQKKMPWQEEAAE